MVIKPFFLLGLSAEYRSWWWVWSLVETQWLTKLTVPETINFSRDMVSDHQNLNGSRDLTTPLSGMACHPCSGACHHQPTYQIWRLYLHSLRRYESDTKCRNGVVGGA